MKRWVEKGGKARNNPVVISFLMLIVISFGIADASPQPYLVKDINTSSNGINPANFVVINGIVYFSATDPIKGTELWKSDGTEAGTVVIKDINPGLSSSNPQQLVNFRGTLYFSATDPIYGTELWKSDGTEAGTVLVKDIKPGSPSSAPEKLTDVDGVLFFSAGDAINGYELWKSDGTEAGTVLVKDINPGTAGSSPANLVNNYGILFFTAANIPGNIELWKSDGTEAGTVLVKDIYPGSRPSNPGFLTSLNGILYFIANNPTTGTELWKSDGTEAGTVLVKDINPGSYGNVAYLTKINGTLFFSAVDPTHATELWKSDGTEAGTVLVKDINPGGINSNPSNLTNVNGMLFFTATDAAHGTELWKSDGTETGTVLVKNINPGNANSSPIYLICNNGTLFFSATTVSNGTELWKSDGTEAGTVLVKDIYPGIASSSPANLKDVSGTLFFTATDQENSIKLWKSDGTEAGSVPVRTINTSTAGSSPAKLTNVSGTLFFAATDSTHGIELWKSDGTAAGTVLVKDIYPGTSGSGPKDLVAVNGSLFFLATTASYGTELWKSDGTEAGTVLVKDVYPGPTGSILKNLTSVNDLLFFESIPVLSPTPELWKSNGTGIGTTVLKNFPRVYSDIYLLPEDLPMESLIKCNGMLFFVAISSIGKELWKSDGTVVGTIPVKDINPGSNGSSPKNLTNVNDTLFFIAADTNGVYALWKSDGTEAGTVIIKNLNIGIGMSNQVVNFTNVNGTLFFTAPDATNGYALWKSDGTEAGTVTVKHMNTGIGSSNLANFTNVNGILFFVVSDSSIGFTLWKSDGTETGTVPVKNICPKMPYYTGTPANFTDLNGTLYFTTMDASSGTELWKSDGTEVGTILVKDIVPGTISSAPNDLVDANGKLFFQATTPAIGAELWALDLRQTDTIAPTTIVTPVGGSYETVQTVTLTCSDTGGSGCAGMYYTTDGSTPTTGSLYYSRPITVSSDTTIRYFSVDIAGNEEPAGIQTYYVDSIAPETSASLPGDMYDAPSISVALICSDSASGCAVTYYTLDGSEPGIGKAIYTRPLNITPPVTLKFMSRDNAGNNEAVKTETYSAPLIIAPITTASASGYDFGTWSNIGSIGIELSATDANGSGVAPGYPMYCIDSDNSCLPAVSGSSFNVTCATETMCIQYVRYHSQDNAGNTETIRSLVVKQDLVLPALTVSTLSDGTWTNNDTLNISGTAADDNGLQGLIINNEAVPINPDNTYSHAVTLELGPNVITVIATDLAGNQTTDTKTINYDPTGPVIDITDPADNSKTKISALTVSGTVDEASTVRVKLNTGDSVPAVMNGSSFSLELVLIYGINTIEVTATDRAGNTTTVKRTVTFDDQNPSLSVTDPAQDIRTNQGSLLIKGETTDLTPVSITITVDSAVYHPTVIDNKFEQAIAFTIEKTYQVNVTATDAAGNQSTVLRNIIYDITAPDVSIDPIFASNQTTRTVTGTMEEGATVTVSCATGTVGTVTYPTATTWSVIISNLSEGHNIVAVYATDATGNSDGIATSVGVDTLAPDTYLETVPPSLTNNTYPYFTFSGAEPDGSVIFYKGLLYECKLNSGQWELCTSPKQYSVPIDGYHTFSVRSKDMAGNVDPTPATYSWTIDLTPPNTPIVTGSTYTNDTTPTWTWTSGGNGGAGIYRYMIAPDLGTWVETTALSMTHPPVPMDGGYLVAVQERDAVGNWSASSYLGIHVDTTAPDTSITSQPADPSSNVSPSFSFTGSDIAGSGVTSFECSLDSGELAACTSPMSYSELAAGTHTFSVRAIDKAGNTDSTPASYTWTIDTIRPTLGAVTPTSTTTEQGRAQTFTAIYRAAEGYANLKTLSLLVNSTLANANGIKVSYDQTTDLLTLYNNAGTAAQGTCAPGAVGVSISNTQGTLNCQTTSVKKAGNNIILKWSITPASAFASTTAKKIYIKATDTATNTTVWTNKATWKIIPLNAKPTLGTVSPTQATSNAGTARLFTSTYIDTDGYANLKSVELLAVETAKGTANGIRTRYDMATNKLYIYNDAGAALVAGGGCTPGAVGKTISNTRGTLNCQTTTVAKSGNTVTVHWSITPKAAFATGINKYLKLRATDNSNVMVGFASKGTWTVNAASAAQSETPTDTYAVIRYGVRNNEPYSYQEEEAMDSAEDILIGVTEQSEDTSELTVAIRKAKAAVPALSGSYRVVEQTAGAAEYEYRFDGKGIVEIIRDSKIIETVPYSVDKTGMLMIGTLSGQVRQDGSVFVLGSAEKAAIIVGTKASASWPEGIYEGAEIRNSSSAINISPKMEPVVVPTDAFAIEDGDVIMNVNGDESGNVSWFDLMRRHKE